MIETITEEQLTPQQAEFWVRARQAVDMNNYPYAVSLLKALVKQLPGFLEGRRALRACEIKLNPEAKKGGLFSGMKISTSKLTSSKKDAATQLSALEDELENDPYSIPVNEALYTAAMDVGFPDLAAFALETVRQGHPGNKKMLHMLASHYVSRDMPAQAAEVYHDLVKLDPTDSVAVKSEKDCMARATMQQQKWEEAKSFRDVMKNSAETNSLDKSDKKGLTRAGAGRTPWAPFRPLCPDQARTWPPCATSPASMNRWRTGRMPIPSTTTRSASATMIFPWKTRPLK